MHEHSHVVGAKLEPRKKSQHCLFFARVNSDLLGGVEAHVVPHEVDGGGPVLRGTLGHLRLVLVHQRGKVVEVALNELLPVLGENTVGGNALAGLEEEEALLHVDLVLGNVHVVNMARDEEPRGARTRAVPNCRSSAHFFGKKR